MEIIFTDEISKIISALIIKNLNIVIYKIKNHELDKDDYNMIISHLIFYKELLEEAKNNGSNN